jgi:hypothetical protein
VKGSLSLLPSAATINELKTPPQKKSLLNKLVLRVLIFLVVLYLLLLIPGPSSSPPVGAGKSPFTWNRDAFWTELERKLADARAAGCDRVADRVTTRMAATDQLLTELRGTNLPPDAKEFDRLETDIFELGALVAICPGRVGDFAGLAERTRLVVKRQSEHWDVHSRAASERLYELLFGTRMALEEVMLQSTNTAVAELTRCEDEPSQTPAFATHGVRLHSGDILVSRGGAPTSALIARGNDHPGSFSHVALLHVDEKTGEATVIESHIECGVATGSFENYLRDKKLRILVLRLRADLPAMKTDPMLPHKAATAALQEFERRHIPYDFAMDYRNPDKQFCSEVVSSAYGTRSIQLWIGPSFISDPVVCAWLGSMGVQFFETQEPADLEYDPQLHVVGEWRDRQTLLKAHADDAVTDTMLALGKPGEPLSYQWWLLPIARVTKAYSMLKNGFGKVGPIPEGMSATQSLRALKYEREHKAITERLLVMAEQFKEEKGYEPPYWELLKLARVAKRPGGTPENSPAF